MAIFEKVTWGHGLPKSDMGKLVITKMASEKVTQKILKNGHSDMVKKRARINDARPPPPPPPPPCRPVLFGGGTRFTVKVKKWE